MMGVSTWGINCISATQQRTMRGSQHVQQVVEYRYVLICVMSVKYAMHLMRMCGSKADCISKYREYYVRLIVRANICRAEIENDKFDHESEKDDAFRRL